MNASKSLFILGCSLVIFGTSHLPVLGQINHSKNIPGKLVFDRNDQNYVRIERLDKKEGYIVGRKDIEQIGNNLGFSLFLGMDGWVKPALIERSKIRYIGKEAYLLIKLIKVGERRYVLHANHDYYQGGDDYYDIDLRNINNPTIKHINLATAQRIATTQKPASNTQIATKPPISTRQQEKPKVVQNSGKFKSPVRTTTVRGQRVLDTPAYDGNKYLGYHTGFDILPKKGSKESISIYPIAPGKVVYICQINTKDNPQCSGFGNSVLIEHTQPDGSKILSSYSHLVTGSIKVSVDEQVDENKEIGTMGTTGYSSGVHLHLAILKPGTSKLTFVQEKYKTRTPLDCGYTKGCITNDKSEAIGYIDPEKIIPDLPTQKK